MLISFFIFVLIMKEFGAKKAISLFSLEFLLWISLAVSAAFILPSCLYVNSYMMFMNLFVAFVPNFLGLGVNISSGDFLVLCMDSKPNPAPPLGGHIITAGVHESKPYVCMDVAETFQRVLKNESSKFAAGFAKEHLCKVADVVCSGLEGSEIPKPNQSK
jgi:hypothetical protein